MPFQGPLEPGDVGAAQPLFILLMQDMHARVRLNHGVRQAPGTVRGIVVHEQNMSLRAGREHGRGDQPDIFRLIIGWNNNQNVGHGGTVKE